jgi:hypothetical protein
LFVLNCVDLGNSNPFYKFRAMLHSTREGQMLRTRCGAEVYRHDILMKRSSIHRNSSTTRLKLSITHLINCKTAQDSSSSELKSGCTSSVLKSGCNGCKLYLSLDISSNPCLTSLRARDTIFALALEDKDGAANVREYLLLTGRFNVQTI